MKALQYLKKIGEGIVVAVGAVLFFVVIFFAGGGMAIFASPDNCTGEREIRVGNASTFWEIAEREFPHDDPRVVTDRLLSMNNGNYDSLHGASIRGPVEC